MNYIITLAFVLLLSSSVSAQQAPRVQQSPVQAISKKAEINEEKAKEVAAVQDTYKAGLKAVMASNELNDEAKRQKIDELITEKNQKLSQILSSEELNKLLPASERIKTDPAFAKQFAEQQESYKKKAALQKNDKPAPRPAISSPEQIERLYASQIKRVKADPNLSAEAKALKIKYLTKEKEAKLAQQRVEREKKSTSPVTAPK